MYHLQTVTVFERKMMFFWGTSGFSWSRDGHSSILKEWQVNKQPAVTKLCEMSLRFLSRLDWAPKHIPVHVLVSDTFIDGFNGFKAV